MDANFGRDIAKKKRKGADQLPETVKVDCKKPQEEAHHGFATVEESTEKCEADDSEQKAALQERAMSAEMEASIQELRQKIDQFTQQVSGLLESVKAFFIETSSAFEERIVLLHQAQIDKWEEEIKLLGMIDSENEEMNFRLSNAQELLTSM
ncbi:hypothetical protein GOP47_0013687 [Adiantum capillus-veneris]|uniref:Uncharacterized protein n=1 Tax=Adiantum capillus-veneris TaxID=13818 RepID=A0A9D4UP72_ADICA|nr:hypothetical protein GOP47_0013687 [Adiantum capillus-veneris]